MARTIPPSSTPADDPALDPSLWTPDQESALLRLLVRYKPVGMHKHFRMIAIHDELLSQGVTTASVPHTSVPGIWSKLGSLYDLAKLDEREDASIMGGDERSGGGGDDDDDNDEEEGADGGGDGDDGDGDDNGTEYWRDFELPQEDFGVLMWERRLKAEGDGSSPALGSSPREGGESAEDVGTDGIRSSPVSAAGPGSARGARKQTRRGGRVTKLQNEATANSSRRTSKTASVAEQDDVEMEEEDADEESGDADESNEENETEEEKRPTKKAKAPPKARAKRTRKK